MGHIVPSVEGINCRMVVLLSYDLNRLRVVSTSKNTSIGKPLRVLGEIELAHIVSLLLEVVLNRNETANQMRSYLRPCNDGFLDKSVRPCSLNASSKNQTLLEIPKSIILSRGEFLVDLLRPRHVIGYLRTATHFNLF